MESPRSILVALSLVALAPALALALAAGGCGDDGAGTVTETVSGDQTSAEATGAAGAAGGGSTASEKSAEATGVAPQAYAAGAPGRGPKYFQTPSRNIGCYISARDARCDIRERSWEPPPEPESCRKIGLDYGGGIVVGADHAEFICAGDTALGGPATLPYGSNARRGAFRCHSGQRGITCSNAVNGHGFFLSRQSYRIF